MTGTLQQRRWPKVWTNTARCRLRCICIVVLVGMSPVSRATHIIGGEMYYDHLGGNQYRVTLDLYRDCGPDNQNGTGFDFEAQLGIFNSAGALLFTQDIADPGETIVPVDLNDPCLVAPPEVCVTTTRYQATSSRGSKFARAASSRMSRAGAAPAHAPSVAPAMRRRTT